MADIAPGDSWRCCSADKFGVVVVGGQGTLFNGLECALLDVGRSSTAGLARNDDPCFWTRSGCISEWDTWVDT